SRPFRTLDHQPSMIWDVGFSPDSRRVGVYLGGQVRIYDVESGQKVLDIPNQSRTLGRMQTRALAFSPDGPWLAPVRSHDILVYEADTGRPQRTLPGHKNAISSLAWSPDSRLLASSSEDGTIRVWEPASSAAPRVLIGHAGIIQDV